MSRQLQAVARIGFAVSALAAPLVAGAQTRAADPNATRVMIDNFLNPGKERNLSVMAADAMRSRIRTDFPFKQVHAIAREEVNAHLQASGFDVTEALAPHDAKALASAVRADEYIQGVATRTDAGFRLEPVLVLTRDNALIQPLGVHEGSTLTAAATSASKELKEARKQIDGERQCVQMVREQKYAEAKTAAQAGIAAYPKATLARVCLANALLAEKQMGEPLLAVAREIVAIHPRSKPGLEFLATAYQELKMNDSMIVTLTRLLQTDPTNGAMVSRIITIIASEANPGVALPIINEAVAQNPSDPELLRLRWRILIAVRNYKEAFAAGEELVKLDTANADTAYFITTATAYVRDSQPQKAAELASRGVAKFPNSGELIYTQVDALRRAGQSQQALEALDRALQAQVPIDGGMALRLSLLRDLNRTDEILPAAKALIAAGDTTSDLRAVVINAANEQRSKVGQSTNPADWAPVLATAAYADSVAVLPAHKVQSSFILGAVYMFYGRAALSQANEKRDCAMAKQAKSMLVEAQILLPKGGAFAPDLMRQYMGIVMQLDTAADDIVSQQLKCS